MHSIICFTSDFGTGDTWVGMCHAVIHRACPQARVVDLAHDIAPFDVRKASAVAAAGVWHPRRAGQRGARPCDMARWWDL